MSQKKVKKMRKELRKKSAEMLEENMQRKLAAEVPIAGCPTCNHQLWYLELDAIPPDHKFITHLICAHPACNQKVIANIDIHAKTEEIETAPDVLQESLCKGCGFDKNDDCQC
jgi:hypothetical protein